MYVYIYIWDHVRFSAPIYIYSFIFQTYSIHDLLPRRCEAGAQELHGAGTARCQMSTLIVGEVP